MNMKKKWIIGLSLPVLALIACGPVEGGEEGNSKGPVASSKTPTDPISVNSSGGATFTNVELNVWSVIGEPDNLYLNKVNEAFNVLYKDQIKVNISAIPVQTFYTSLANTIQSDPENAPDVVIYHSERLTSFIDNNIIIPLDDYFQYTGTNFDRNDYLDNVISECYGYKDNKLYGVPLDVHAGVWFTRSDILEKNGLAKPTNLTEFENVCNALIRLNNEGKMWHRAMNSTTPLATEWTQIKLDDFAPVSMYAKDNIESGWIPQTAVFQNGGELVGQNGRPAWKTEGLAKTMTRFRNWKNGTGYAGKFIADNLDENSIWTNLASGNAVFTCEGPWWVEKRLDEYEEVLKEKKDKDGKTYAPLDILNMSKLYAEDASKECANYVYGVGHCFSVTRTCDSNIKRAAGLLYAQYMTSHSSEYMQGGHLPASKTVLESKQYKTSSFYNRYLKEFGDPKNFKMLGRTPYYEEVYGQLKKVYVDTLDNNYKDKSIQQIIDARYSEAINAIESKEEL